MSDLTRDLMEYGLDCRARRVFLQTYIGEDESRDYNAAEYVTRGLLFLERQATQPIQLWINSPGGSVDDALAIHDVIRSLTCPVITVGHGFVASAATLILAAGTGKRYVTPSCVFMHHEGDGDISVGGLAVQRAQLAQREATERVWGQLMARYTKHTAKWWLDKAAAEGEVYMNSKQMLSAGVADDLWE